MRHAPTIAGVLLGLPFIVFGLNHFLNFITMPAMPPPPELARQFMGPFISSGYLDFVKVLEVLGGLLVAFPKTRNLGLLVLGPIIVNILAYHIFLNKGATLLDPVLILICLLALFLLWSERRAFAGLVHRQPPGA